MEWAPLPRSVPTCVSAPGSEGPPEQGHGYLSLWSKLCPQLLQTAAIRPPEDLTWTVRLAPDSGSREKATQAPGQDQEGLSARRIRAPLLLEAQSRGGGGLWWTQLPGPGESSSSEERHS